MKKILIIILLLLLTPTLVNAETNYLYDVLKNEAENNGLAREYTMDHQDSLTEEPSQKVYYWYTINDEEADQILEKNNVIFGGFCWQTIRTTDTGGVKLIYNGIPNEGKCNNTGSASTIGGSRFNSTQTTVADVGYMKNSGYMHTTESVLYTERTQIKTGAELSTAYKYADDIEWNSTTNKWDMINPFEISSEEEFSNLVGKYTFLRGTYTSDTVARYITSVEDGKITYIELKDGNTLSYYNHTYVYGDNYSTNPDGTYSINNPTTITLIEYPQHYGNIKQKYICKNPNNNKCQSVSYVYSSSLQDYTHIVQNKYKFANGFTYENGKYYLNQTNEFIYSNPSNLSQMKMAHYTCWNIEGECTDISYVYYHREPRNIYTQKLRNGDSIEDRLNKMVNNENVNTNDSVLKTKIENWFEENMLPYIDDIEDVIYCSGRKPGVNFNSWNPNGGNYNNNISLIFKSTMKCENITDSFSTSNDKAKLKYPVGLITREEMAVMSTSKIKNIGVTYWLMNPYGFGFYFPYYNTISTDGSILPQGGDVPLSFGVRPAISLKSNMGFKEGDGSKNNPYIIKEIQKYSVDVQINNETEEFDINIEDLTQVDEGEEVNFKVIPIKGHKVTSIRIVDENNNEVEYNTTDNKNFVFTMPATNVTIIPSYERVKNAVNVEDNKNTKEFVIEVNDATAVVYEDKVRFRVEPEDGYEVERIDITDEQNNKINYKKTNTINEYEFTMPDTNVLIKPFYRLINRSNLPNPNTKRQILLIVISALILSIMTIIFIKKKKRLN